MSSEHVAVLLTAIQDGKPWMDQFTRKGYGKAFQAYRDRFASLYREEVLTAGEEGLAALAETLVDALAESWKRQRPWNRSLAKVADQQVIVCYLSPMLLEDPLCAPLAEKLREEWAARWPKEAYRITTREKLQKGFRPSILGIPLPVQEEDGGGE